jgi:hypothetical protein
MSCIVAPYSQEHMLLALQVHGLVVENKVSFLGVNLKNRSQGAILDNKDGLPPHRRPNLQK